MTRKQEFLYWFPEVLAAVGFVGIIIAGAILIWGMGGN